MRSRLSNDLDFPSCSLSAAYKPASLVLHPSLADTFRALYVWPDRWKKFVHAKPQPATGPALVEERHESSSRPRRLRSLLWLLGPSLIAGAANDDPCAIGTYAKAGAEFGFTFLWTAPFTFPMIATTVYLCSKLSMVTGKGIAGVVRDYYPRWLLYSMVTGVLIANIVEAGADIGAIAASLRLFFPVPVTGITIGITLLILALQTWGSYQLLQKIFAGLALALFAYVGAAILAKPNLGELLWATITPKLHFTRDYLAMLVALIGTRLSPYLYFWQSSQKVDETLIGCSVAASRKELRSTACDVNAGMFFSNLIMYFVILCTAATLFRVGGTSMETAAQAAQALRPLAGNAASLLFALGIIGVGILAVPVLTTGPAHALAETFGWKHGLRNTPRLAPEFYAVIAVSTGVAIAIGLSGINPITALFWASVVMGLLAPPLMFIIMLAVSNRSIMGDHTNGTWVKFFGWITTATVTAAAAGLVWSWIR